MKSRAYADKMALGVLFALCAILFWQTLAAGSGEVVGGIDIITIYYNYKSFVKEAYLSGHFPLWNPYYYCGHPFAGNSVAAAFYPLDLFFLALPVERAINISFFVHIFIAGVFMFCWMRHFEATVPSLASAIVFMFCGFFTAHISAGHFSMVRTAVYIPLIFCCYERALRSGKKVWVIFGGFVFGLQLLVGHPQIAYYSIMFLGLYALCRYLNNRTLKNAWSSLLTLSITVLFGIATAAVSLVPMLELSSLSVRTEASYGYASTMSMNPLRLISLFFPNATVHWPGVLEAVTSGWEWDSYIGVLPLFLALVAVTSRRRHTMLFGAMAAAALLVAFGSYTPLFRAMYHVVPGIKLFRIHSRCLIVFTFFSATLAGIGLGALLELNGRGAAPVKRTPSVIWSLLALALIVFVLAGPDIYFRLIYEPGSGRVGQVVPLGPIDGELLFPALFILLTTLTGWVVHLKKVPSQWLKLFLIAVITFDLILSGWAHVAPSQVSDYFRSSRFVESLRGATGRFRVLLSSDILPPNHGMVYHIENLDGYTPYALKRTIRFIEAATRIEPFRFFWNYEVNPEYFSSGRPFPYKILNVLYTMAYDASSDGMRLVKNPVPFPRAIWVRNAEVLPGPEAVLKRLVSEDFDPYHTVLFEEDPCRPLTSAQTSVTWAPATIADYQINRITVTLEAPDDGWLLLSEQYYPGWKATCDGKPVDVYRADYILRAAAVPAGRHTVVFNYAPASFITGAGLSLASVLVFFAVASRFIVEKKERPAASEGEELSGRKDDDVQ